MSIADNVQSVLGDIAEAAFRTGRDPSDITLVAVSKTRTVEEIIEACEAGIMHIGENRVQEALSKIPQVPGDAVWHMVGHLQSNKVKPAVALFDWIDSVDSKKLIDSISERAERKEKKINVLIQVNISGENSKSGVQPGEVKEFVVYASNKKRLQVQGLMTIGSLGVARNVTQQEFARMKELYDMLREEPDIGSYMNVLSMGMSGDFLLAVEEGSTMVRIGTALFGARYK